MKTLFVITAIIQLILFITLHLGIRAEIIEKDLYTKLANFSYLIIFLLSIYMIIK